MIVIQNSQGSLLKIQSVCPSDRTIAGIPHIRYYLDRTLDVPFPAAYGFIYGTVSGDGDPEDVWVIHRNPLHTGEVIEEGDLHYVGEVLMTDDDEGDPKKIYFLPDDRVKGQLVLRDLKYILQRLSFILAHLKIYKMGSVGGLVESTRIRLLSLRLDPGVEARYADLRSVVPYPELLKD